MDKLIKPIVQLRIYKGAEKAFNGAGKCLNENQKVTLLYNSLEWNNYFRYVQASGFGIIELEACYIDEKQIETPKEISDFVANVFKTPEKELTAGQKQIIEMQKQIDALTKKDSVLFTCQYQNNEDLKQFKIILNNMKNNEVIFDYLPVSNGGYVGLTKQKKNKRK